MTRTSLLQLCCHEINKGIIHVGYNLKGMTFCQQKAKCQNRFLLYEKLTNVIG